MTHTIHRFADKGPAWRTFILVMRSGNVVEIDREMYDYFLGVLPPVYMGRRVTLPDGREVWADFGFAEGWDCITAFWRHADTGRCFCCRTTEVHES